MKNFICLSSFNNNLDWFKDFNHPHIIYDKCSEGVKKTKNFPYDISPTNLKKKYPNFNISKGELGGYNINEYLRFIINNYDNLPQNIAFIKGNIINRHVSRPFLEKVIDNKYFTSIEEWKEFHPKKYNLFTRSSYISSEGGWVEINNNWYLNKKKHPNKFFNNFNTFMSFIFKSYINPKYIRFCPGANYIVPKSHILKYDLVFYRNLKFLIDYDQLSGESHILERALFSIWNSEYSVSDIMKTPFNTNTNFPNKDNIFKAQLRKLISKI